MVASNPIISLPSAIYHLSLVIAAEIAKIPATARNNQINHDASIQSLEFVPNTTPAALLIQMAVLDQVAEMLL